MRDRNLVKGDMSEAMPTGEVGVRPVLDGAVAPAEALRACAPAGLFRDRLEQIAPAVRRYLFGMCGDWSLAEDLAQEAMLKAWRNRAGFDGRSEVGTWVFAIARNCWLDHLRRRKAAPTMMSVTQDMPLPARHEPPGAGIWRAELSVALSGAMARLPDDQREALSLRESQGLSFTQISQLLDIPVATAKSRVRYALMKLAVELEPFGRHLE